MRQLASTPAVFKELGKNIMTPDIIGYWKVGKLYVELSSGEGMTRNTIYGVTVRPDPDHSKSVCLHSLVDAMDYIATLEG